MANGLSTYLAMQERDRVTYQPGERGFAHVRVIVTEAGLPDPSVFEVNGAWLDMGAPVGASVGEVAEHLIRRGGELDRLAQPRLF